MVVREQIGEAEGGGGWHLTWDNCDHDGDGGEGGQGGEDGDGGEGGDGGKGVGWHFTQWS